MGREEGDFTLALISRLRAASFGQLLSYAVLAYTVYWLVIFVYRVTLHPLAKFPGPKLAGLTYWYEFYYDVLPHDGRYLWKIQELHEKHGPIIRINPYCVHILDPDFYDEVYGTSGHKRDKDTWFMPGTGSNIPLAGSTFLAPTHDHHRQRRGAVGQFFSMKSVRALEPLVQEKIDVAMQRLHEEMERGTVVNLSELNAGVALDIISAYCFGDGMHTLELPTYGKSWRDQMNAGAASNVWGRHLPWLFMTMMRLPPSVLLKMNPMLAETMEWIEYMETRIKAILSGKEAVTPSQYPHRTIFHEIKDSDLPPHEKTSHRLMGEALNFLGAGTETSSRALSNLDYYILADARVHRRLVAELRGAMPARTSAISLDQAMKLPYLAACVNECLRIAQGIPGRLPRIAPDEDVRYKEWIIPRGCGMTESIFLVHMDPNIFPDPYAFKPERWLDHPELLKYLVPFSKGPRACMGQNLARSELFVLTARLFRRFELELHDTSYERDVFLQHDGFIGYADKKSLGIRAKVVRELDD